MYENYEVLDFGQEEYLDGASCQYRVVAHSSDGKTTATVAYVHDEDDAKLIAGLMDKRPLVSLKELQRDKCKKSIDR